MSKGWEDDNASNYTEKGEEDYQIIVATQTPIGWKQFPLSEMGRFNKSNQNKYKTLNKICCGFFKKY